MVSGNTVDKRRHDRLQHSTQVDFSDGQLFMHGDIKDISLGGIQIECFRKLDIGTDIIVALPISSSLKLKGIVRWVKRKGVNYYIGIQFLNVTPEQESGIREVIQALFWKTAKA